MDIAFILGSKIVELTLIVLMGYGLVKAKLLKSEDSKPLSIIGLYRGMTAAESYQQLIGYIASVLCLIIMLLLIWGLKYYKK